jgi:hypothetical protein
LTVVEHSSIQNFNQVDELRTNSSAFDFRENRVTQDSKPTLADQLIQIRSIAQTSLARYAKADPGESKEVYLFNKDQFCGIRFSLGAFHASWHINESTLNVHRGEHRLEQIAVDNNAQTNRAA